MHLLDRIDKITTIGKEHDQKAVSVSVHEYMSSKIYKLYMHAYRAHFHEETV